jgi:SAM-dependent methyltransferase
MGHNWAGAPGTLQSYGPRFISRRRLIRRLVKVVKPKRSLDIGCGSGLITKLLAEVSDEVVAVDVSEEAIDVTRGALGETTSVLLKTVDIFDSNETVSEWKESFDLVVLSEVLEHIPDDQGALATAWRLLSNRRWLLLTVPGDPKLWNAEDERVGHVRRYTREELRRKLTDSGFEIDEIINWGFPLTKWLFRLEVRRVERRRPARNNGRSHPPPLPMPLLALARPFIGALAHLEAKLSWLDRGVGYVVLARKADTRTVN